MAFHPTLIMVVRKYKSFSLSIGRDSPKRDSVLEGTSIRGVCDSMYASMDSRTPIRFANRHGISSTPSRFTIALIAS